MKRAEALRMAIEIAPDDALWVLCNGRIGREAFSIRDRPQHFYMMGSMGLGLSIALGLALAQPARKVLCVDGDANVLMNLGVVATVAARAPANLHHLILDNEAHGSTGGQATISNVVPIEAVAAACGWAWSRRAGSDLEQALGELFATAGPSCLLVKVDPADLPGIPRISRSPRQIADAFRSGLAQ